MKPHISDRLLPLLAALVSVTMLPAQTAPLRSTGNAPRPSREPGGGLMYYAKADFAFADNQAVIANPHICGALLQVIWGEVEKENGKSVWRQVDQWLQPWL